jgi:hypothetical protein
MLCPLGLGFPLPSGSRIIDPQALIVSIVMAWTERTSSTNSKSGSAEPQAL